LPDVPAVVGIILCLVGPPLYAVAPILGYGSIVLGLAALSATPLFHHSWVVKQGDLIEPTS
jgi:hypothetical protein